MPSVKNKKRDSAKKNEQEQIVVRFVYSEAVFHALAEIYQPQSHPLDLYEDDCLVDRPHSAEKGDQISQHRKCEQQVNDDKISQHRKSDRANSAENGDKISQHKKSEQHENDDKTSQQRKSEKRMIDCEIMNISTIYSELLETAAEIASRKRAAYYHKNQATKLDQNYRPNRNGNSKKTLHKTENINGNKVLMMQNIRKKKVNFSSRPT